MKKVFLIISVFLLGIDLTAQTVFFPSKEGAVLTYDYNNENGNLLKTVRYTITKVSQKDDGLAIDYLSEIISLKNKVLNKKNYSSFEKGKEFYFLSDMSIYLNMDLSNNTEVITILPSEPKPGDKLTGFSHNVMLSSWRSKTLMDVRNSKVEALENITVRAGTFPCCKISCTVDASGMGKKDTIQQYAWYTKGIGLVKMESYEKGKLSFGMELTTMKNMPANVSVTETTPAPTIIKLSAQPEETPANSVGNTQPDKKENPTVVKLSEQKDEKPATVLPTPVEESPTKPTVIKLSAQKEDVPASPTASPATTNEKPEPVKQPAQQPTRTAASSPTGNTTPTVTTTTPPSRAGKTGDTPYAYCYGADHKCTGQDCSQIKVVAPNNSDVLVTLKKDNKVVAHAYICANSSYTFEVANGVYQPFFYYGKSWSPEKTMKMTDCGVLKGGFTQNENFGKDTPQSLNNNRLTYELVLQQNGNFSTRPSNVNEAF